MITFQNLVLKKEKEKQLLALKRTKKDLFKQNGQHVKDTK